MVKRHTNTATYENMEVNNIDKNEMDVYAGNILEDTELQDKVNIKSYDIIVANILADVIMPLSDILKDKIHELPLNVILCQASSNVLERVTETVDFFDITNNRDSIIKQVYEELVPKPGKEK